MTKAEEILNSLFVLPTSQDWFKPVLKAMDEYARQEAIGFAEWVNVNRYYNVYGEHWMPHPPHTVNELYDLYLKSKT